MVDFLTPHAEDGPFRKLNSKTASDHLARLENNKRLVHYQMVKAREYQKQQFDRHHREHSAMLKPGPYAYLSSEGVLMPRDRNRKAKKLRARSYGPFEILQQLGPTSYRLSLPEQSKIHDVFHAALLKPAASFDPRTHGSLVEQFPEREEDQEYEVERILASRENADGETFYLVKWLGYLYEESTWEPKAHLANSTRKNREFELRSSQARYVSHEDMLADEIYTQSQGH